MPRLTASVWISADPDRVYEICTEPPIPLLPAEGPRLLILDKPGTVGCRYRWQFNRFGLRNRLDSVVTEAVHGCRLAFRHVAGWEMEASLNLAREAGGTRLMFQMTYRFPFPLRWLLPGGLIRLGVWHALNRVKTAAEGGCRVGQALTGVSRQT